MGSTTIIPFCNSKQNNTTRKRASCWQNCGAAKQNNDKSKIKEQKAKLQSKIQ
jgi:hypothetical protein